MIASAIRISGSVSIHLWLSAGLASASLFLLRVGTFDLGPTWDGAMSVWPAAIEIAKDWNLARVLSLPSYIEGGPNTHTLSLFTLIVAGLVALFDPGTTFLIVQFVSALMTIAIALLLSFVVIDLGHPRLAPWIAVAFVSYPMVVGQSAYLYTEIPSALLAFAGLVLAYVRRPIIAVLAMALAIWVKALALVAIPALMWVIWRRQRSTKAALSASLAVLALIPAFIVPQAVVEQNLVDRLSGSLRFSVAYLIRSPELIVVFVAPMFVALAFRRIAASEDEKLWLQAVSLLNSTFVAFFILNAVATAGYFFLPRYALLLLPGTFVLGSMWLSRIQALASRVVMAVVLVGFMATARGPLALGADTSLHPVAERSLAYTSLLADQRAGLDRLDELSETMPVFFDHYAMFGYKYPLLGHFDGVPPSNGATTFPETTLDRGLSAQPAEFALMYSVPILGGEWMEFIRNQASASSDYQVTEELIGSTQVSPLRIVIIKRLSG